MRIHRDKQLEQKQRIKEALEEVISEQGIAGVNVSLIARKAGVSKGIIYRNFGGEAGLLLYFVHANPAFPHLDLAVSPSLCPQQQERISQSPFGQMFQSFRELRSSKASRHIIKAMLTRDNSLVDSVCQIHERKLAEMVQQLPVSKRADGQAAMAILLGGMYYVTVMAHNNQPFLGIDVRSDSGWLRIEQALKNLYNQLTNSENQNSSTTLSSITAIPNLVDS